MIVITVVFLIIDIVSKILVSNLLEEQVSINIIHNFFNLTYVKNTGAAWSIMDDKSYLVLIISGLIILGLVLYIYKNKSENKFEKFAYAMILGGAFGNFVDRIVYGYVIDFLDFTLFGYSYPIFNFADVFIVLGVIFLIGYTWRCNGDRDRSNRK